MGWSGGTEIFDSVVDTLMDYVPIGRLSEEIEKIAEVFWDNDWDSPEDSRYFESYLVHIMHERGDIDDEDYEIYN